MSSRKKISRKKYDEKECWDLAMSWGAAFTTDRLLEWHVKNKGFGSRMGGIWAMWRWAAKNPELCYPQYKQWYFENKIGKTEWVEEGGKLVEKNIDPNIDFRGFLQEISNHAEHNTSILAARKYKEFCEKHEIGEVKGINSGVKLNDLARILIDRYGDIIRVDDMIDDDVPYYALMVIESLQKEKNKAWSRE